MDALLYQRIHAVLTEIGQLDPSDRESTISAFCGDDALLCKEVLAFLEAEDEIEAEHAFADEQILENRAALERIFDAPKRSVSSAILPEHIAHYRVIRCIGEGGMGIVYECEQPSPRRRVAVKVVDAFRGSPELQRRLINEAQIQGRLQHSAIAQVYEAGIAPIGERERPYFAMEFIDGRPINTYCTDNSLSVSKRLELIARVADGLEYAHHSGVIHRDLKPDNILVTADGQPKVLDFGIARVTGEASMAATAMTRSGQILGTLAYMAPEQLASDPDSTTHAADVYAIGVILFELLTGRQPIELGGLSVVSAMRLLDIHVPTSVRTFDPGLDRDIETIVMHCLRREPGARYERAGALASDIRRYLSHRPVLARPTTRAYRAHKFVQRNRLLVGGVVATTLALVAGTVVATVFGIGQSQARVIADEQRQLARQKELEAAGGVISGAIVLSEIEQPWAARQQLGTVRHELRGWEWNHVSLNLPWVIDSSGRNAPEDNPTMRINMPWISDHEIFSVSRDTFKSYVLDVLTETWEPLPSTTPDIERFPRWRGEVPEHVMVNLQDGRFGLLNARTGVFLEKGVVPEGMESTEFPRTVSDDGRAIIHRDYSAAILWGYLDGNQTFAMESGHTNPPEMNWNMSEFVGKSATAVISRWATATEGASLFVFDVQTGEQLGHIDFGSSHGPNLRVAPDQSVYCIHRSRMGIEVRSLPNFELIRVIDLAGLLPMGLAMSPDGSRLATVVGNPYPDRGESSLRIIDTHSEQTIYEASIGAERFRRDPQFSPDGMLLAARAANTQDIWLIDTYEQNGFESITTLNGHNSWIYQLAISPDGSLLASAAPDGDILIWDLNLGTPLARVDRFSDASNQLVTAHNMDAPLLFDPDGDELVFGEIDPESLTRGLTRLDLHTGERSWTHTGSWQQTLDAAARLTDPSKPAVLYHHSAKLADGRILQAGASLANSDAVGIRKPNQDTLYMTFGDGYTQQTLGGVAVSPSGNVVATGEVAAVRIRDPKDGSVLHVLEDVAESFVYGMAFSNDGSRFALCTDDGRIIVYDSEFYTKLLELNVPPPEGASRAYIFSLMWTPDDRRLVTCSGSTIRIFESERAIVRFKKREAWLTDLSLVDEDDQSASDAATNVRKINSWSDVDRN